MQLRVQIGQREVEVEVGPALGSAYQVSFDGRVYAADFVAAGSPSAYSLLLDGVSHEVYIQKTPGQKTPGELLVTIEGQQYAARVQAERTPPIKVSPASLVAPDEQRITAPLPGVIVGIPVSVGDLVEPNTSVIVLESMKMNNPLRVPAGGRVSAIYVQPGQRVERGQLLVVVA